MKKSKNLKLCVGQNSIQSCNRKADACIKCEHGEGHNTVKLLPDLELVELYGKSVMHINGLESILKELSDFREHSRFGKLQNDVLSSLINRTSSILKDMKKDGSIISCNLYFKYRSETSEAKTE